MIVVTIFDFFLSLFDKLTSGINLPNLPPDVNNYLVEAFDLMQEGIYILNNIMDMKYFLSLAFIMIGIDVGVRVYHFIMWVVKKIPMLNIS